MSPAVAPRITGSSWGRIETDDGRSFKDAKLWPGGGREWDWTETGTGHRPGIQGRRPRDLEDVDPGRPPLPGQPGARPDDQQLPDVRPARLGLVARLAEPRSQGIAQKTDPHHDADHAIIARFAAFERGNGRDHRQ